MSSPRYDSNATSSVERQTRGRVGKLVRKNRSNYNNRSRGVLRRIQNAQRKRARCLSCGVPRSNPLVSTVMSTPFPEVLHHTLLYISVARRRIIPVSSDRRWFSRTCAGMYRTRMYNKPSLWRTPCTRRKFVISKQWQSRSGKNY